MGKSSELFIEMRESDDSLFYYDTNGSAFTQNHYIAFKDKKTGKILTITIEGKNNHIPKLKIYKNQKEFDKVKPKGFEASPKNVSFIK